MACHSDHRHFAQTCLFGDVETQLADDFSWLHPVGYLVFGEAYSGHQRRFKLLCFRVYQSRGGGDGIFTNFASCQEVGEKVGHEENLLGVTVCHTTFLGLGKHLEYAIEAHDLDARQRIKLFMRYLFEELFGNAISVRVAVGAWQT